MQDEIVKVEQVTGDVVYQSDRATIDTQIATAKQYPRNVTRAIQNSLAIVTLDAKTAESCSYSVPRGGKAITGPSVHVAKIIAQNWGNLRIEARVTAVDQTHVTSEAVCFDLETNIAIKTQVKRSIVGKHGRFNEDMITVTGNAANSIALRNAILSVIPKGVVDKVYNEAKKMITGDVSDQTKLIAKRKQVFDQMKDSFEVTEKEILSVVGKETVNHVTADDLVVLIGVGTAIRDGDTNIEQAFRSSRKPQKSSSEAEDERIKHLINDAKTVEEVEKYEKEIALSDFHKELAKKQKFILSRKQPENGRI